MSDLELRATCCIELYANVLKAGKFLFGEGLHYFDSLSEVKRRNKMRDVISEEVSRQMVEEIRKNAKTGALIMDAERARLSREYGNLADSFQLTIEHLAANVDDPSSKNEITEDWLSQYRDLAVRFSSTEMQYGFARILAGEIRQPGSFSPLTLHRYSLLSQRAAELLHRVANCMVEYRDGKCQVHRLSRTYSADGFEAAGLNYGDFLYLEQYGLVQSDANIFLEIKRSDLENEGLLVGGVAYKIEPTGPATEYSFDGPILSEAGEQIARVLDRKPNSEYLEHWTADVSVKGINTIPL